MLAGAAGASLALLVTQTGLGGFGGGGADLPLVRVDGEAAGGSLGASTDCCKGSSACATCWTVRLCAAVALCRRGDDVGPLEVRVEDPSVRGEWAACSSWRMRSRSESGGASAMGATERVGRTHAGSEETSGDVAEWQPRRLQAESTLFQFAPLDCSSL